MSKNKHVSNNIQNIINEKLLKTIVMKNFINTIKTEKVANTFGVKCPNCGVMDNIFAETLQLRSADEAADKICTCLNCNYTWKISG